MRRKRKRGFEFELTLSQQLKEFGSKIKLGLNNINVNQFWVFLMSFL